MGFLVEYIHAEMISPFTSPIYSGEESVNLAKARKKNQ